MMLLSIFPSLGEIIWFAVGVGLGALIFRNNKVAGEKLVQKLKQKVKDLENEAKSKL